MASQTPLVATDVGGVPDVVEQGITGLLVPRRDPDALAEGLVSLLNDPERRAAMAAAGTEVLQRYTIKAIADRFAELYDTLLI
jgi:D-inositol-3-phosphate glycosyltransferase